MSSLMKTTATQENPIYNMDVPDSSATTSDITNPPTVTVDDPVDAIVTLPAATGNETYLFSSGELLEIFDKTTGRPGELSYCLTLPGYDSYEILFLRKTVVVFYCVSGRSCR